MKLGTVVKTTFVVGLLITLIGAYIKATHSEGAEVFLIIGAMAWLSFIVATIYEVRTSDRIDKIEKTTWTIAFIVFGGIAGLIYFLTSRRRIVSSNEINHQQKV